MKRSLRIKKHANTQFFCAGVMFIFALSMTVFAWASYLHEEALWLGVCVLASIGSNLAGYFHLSEYLRLNRLAFREAMEELAIWQR